MTQTELQIPDQYIVVTKDGESEFERISKAFLYAYAFICRNELVEVIPYINGKPSMMLTEQLH